MKLLALLGLGFAHSLSNSKYTGSWWFDQRIHNFGNIGVGGRFHAFCAPHASKLIDKISYNGINVRQKALENSQKNMKIYPENAVDLGCGVGVSSLAIIDTFPRTKVTGIDCSTAMLNKCPRDSKIIFEKQLAHQTNIPSNSVDLVNCMFFFHEIPQYGRIQLLQEIERILKPGGYLNILDISLSYVPNRAMLAGEPYLLDYLEYFGSDISATSLTRQEKETIPNMNQFDMLFRKV